MRLKPWLWPIILILSSCGPHAPAVNDCIINLANLNCPKDPKNPIITPSQADRFICQSPSDFLNSKLYIINLETNFAKCNQMPVVHPKVTDCTIDGNLQILYCSDGASGFIVSWFDANKFICVSPSDFTLLMNYKNQLIQDIADCKK